MNFLISVLVALFIIAPQYSYGLDDTNDRLEFNSNQSNLTDICKKINSNNFTKTQFYGSLNSSTEESLLFSKCCFYNYTNYLKDKENNKTSIDYILDIFQGTVKLNI